ncbi:unnamed protein product [Allacma fusca]|uniref:Uncharacterized protein n=1 Tax=Allacma fusca TaxID=39272 RepID=A0A8J2NSN4_9HEXA|nr:unnamed protein product [Allacma fusca]
MCYFSKLVATIGLLLGLLDCCATKIYLRRQVGQGSFCQRTFRRCLNEINRNSTASEREISCADLVKKQQGCYHLIQGWRKKTTAIGSFSVIPSVVNTKIAANSTSAPSSVKKFSKRCMPSKDKNQCPP